MEFQYLGGGEGRLDLLWLHREFDASLGYTKQFLTKLNQQKEWKSRVRKRIGVGKIFFQVRKSKKTE